jgi:hypothetical protein
MWAWVLHFNYSTQCLFTATYMLCLVSILFERKIEILCSKSVWTKINKCTICILSLACVLQKREINFYFKSLFVFWNEPLQYVLKTNKYKAVFRIRSRIIHGIHKFRPSGSGSVSQGYGSEPPDPYQNVTDPEHWKKDELRKIAAPDWTKGKRKISNVRCSQRGR